MRVVLSKPFYLLFLTVVPVIAQSQTVLNFVSLSPCRVIDTRVEGSNGLGSPRLSANNRRDFPLRQSSCSISPNALAYAVNLTVVPHASLPYLTIWPTGQPMPNVSTLNSLEGAVIANAAIVPAGINGSVSVYAAGDTDLIVDITGYFLPPSTAVTDSLAQQIGQTNQTLVQVSQQVSQQGQQIGQLNQQIGQTNQTLVQVSQQVSQQGQQIGQLNQQVSPLTQQITQVSQQISQVSQQSSQLRQMMAQISQQSTATANVSGTNNVGLGTGAFSGNLVGDSNIAIGANAGSGLTRTSNSIEVGNVGQASDNGVIRIGTPGTHVKTFVAGITGVTVDIGEMVLVDENGQLGTLLSSRRYKEDVQDIGKESDGLMKLRPVQYRYKQPTQQGEKPLQYGLIAEEVAEVYPELVVYNHEGEAETVQYHKLPALLLNELQKQHRLIDEQRAELQRQSKELQKVNEEAEQARQERHQLQIRLKELEHALPRSRNGEHALAGKSAQ